MRQWFRWLGVALGAAGVLFGSACTPRSLPVTAAITAPATTAPTLLPTAPLTQAVTPLATENTAPAATWLPPPETGGFTAAYTKEGDLWLWQDGAPRQITGSGQVYQPRFSADGKLIAFLKKVDDFHLEVWVIGADGSDERRLVSVADMDTIGATARSAGSVAINPYQLAWSPVDHTLFFNSQQIFRGPAPAPLDDLNRVDADSGALSFLLLAGWGGEFALSPDGRQVAISTPGNIFVARPDGTEYRGVLSYDPVNLYTESRFYARPVWAADAATLFVAIPPADPLAELAQLTVIWRIPTDGSQPQHITSLAAVPPFDTPVAFSPDGQYLSSIKEIGQPGEIRRELNVFTTDGAYGGPYFAGEMLNFAGWAADSRHFFYSLGEDQALYLGVVDGPTLPLSPEPYGVLQIRWLGDGRFVYIQQKPDGFELRLATPGSTAVALDAMVGLPDFDVAPASE